jgi:hypothetical protein
MVGDPISLSVLRSGSFYTFTFFLFPVFYQNLPRKYETPSKIHFCFDPRETLLMIKNSRGDSTALQLIINSFTLRGRLWVHEAKHLLEKLIFPWPVNIIPSFNGTLHFIASSRNPTSGRCIEPDKSYPHHRIPFF